MSESTFKERLPFLKRQYAAMRTKRAKGRLLDSVTSCFTMDRKYLIKLLTGRRCYRNHAGRGPTYSPGACRLVIALWREAGRPCGDYLQAAVARLLADYADCGHDIGGHDRAQALRMSASTIKRIIRRQGGPPPPRRRNRHSGDSALKRGIPALPGRELPEDVTGTCQIDTVMLCGGDMSGQFFSLATLTDSLTQWFECAPCWNHGAAATSAAVAAIHARLPFDIRHLHPDNGGEFINHIFIGDMAELVTGGSISRSRPYRKNDNCRIEQKNGSVARIYFGDLRCDDPSQHELLAEICRDIAAYTNFFAPSRKLVRKVRSADAKGVKYVKTYDAPATPLDRLDRAAPDDPRVIRLKSARDGINGIRLLKSIHRRLRRLVREMHSGLDCGGIPPPSSPEQADGQVHLSVSMHLTEPVCR